ncbi:hypothetical protein L226DRAFT_500934 [Lentinus tigrinus ALCF2SS1-7]|uniref:HSF-type DNA-binding domain-containing protein n=1 Tax=Lentinus tigrinus ALCF2SS1-6 TaxID=1328759 RepID=A0A5C2ST80_9APHY|nr:hypothetical protein L227DRAFT_590609 [Lentinus tigrinus ALCF2SS1-6]RPD80430.1 hypothetical protein L226DRAFT_500934 [Lentinus tigrinus ALCF2SS1-7]
MSQASQVAIAGPSALVTPQSTTKTHQHNIPRFLLKLYEILNDPANENLIKWSDAGDSFYIYNQERFAREVLGKWFKHQNFSSFVRQLNLYGFRKISALQQGLLRMDNETEHIQFAHPYFHRGQPDLLALIQRKRHPPNHVEDSALGLLQAPPSQDGQGQTQAVDVRSIVEGISTIRRQQQAISADLSALKQSNDALWKEAIEARERHAKHEDTINRILKFLAGLFGRVMQGHNNDQLHSDAKPTPPRRLLIGDGRTSHGEGGDHFGAEFEGNSDAGSRAHSPFSVASERFASIETPGASNASPTLTANEVAESKSPPKPVKYELHDVQPMNPPTTLPAAAPQTFTAGPATTLPAAVDQTAASPDAMWQAALHQMMSSPSHFQRVMQTFANAQPYNIPADPSTGLGVPGSLPPAALSAQQLTYPALAYAAQSSQPQSHPVIPASSSNPNIIHDPLFLASAPVPAPAPGPQDAALLANSNRMNKAYQDASEINADMDALQSNIHSLIRDMGLDPNNPSFPSVETSTGSALPTGSSSGGLSDHEPWSFDSWLNQVNSTGLPDLGYPASPGKAGGDPSGEDFSAFLDIPAFDTAPPSAAAAASAPATTAASTSASAPAPVSPSGVKRKLDAADVLEAPPGGGPSRKKRG